MEPATETRLDPDPAAPDAPVPRVAIGRTSPGGIGPSIFALVERGVLKRPALAGTLRGSVALRFREELPAVAIRFEPGRIVVEDAELPHPDLVVTAGLADVVLLTTSPLRMGLPSPTDGRGRAVIGRMATGRIRLAGDIGLARGMLELMWIDVRAHKTRDRLPPTKGAPPGWIEVLT